MKQFSPEAKVGLVTLVGLLLLIALFAWKGDLFLRSRGIVIQGIFQNVGGLQDGAEVRYRGYKVGKVSDIFPGPLQTRVRFYVQNSLEIPTDSHLRIAFDGLIGQKYIELMPGESHTYLSSGGTLEGFSTLGLVDFLHVGTKNLEESQKILQDVQGLTGDKTFQQKAKQVLNNLEETTSEISNLVRQLRGAIEEGQVNKLIERTASVIERFDAITAQISAVTNDPNFPQDIKKIVKGSNDTLEEIRAAASDLRLLIRRYSR